MKRQPYRRSLAEAVSGKTEAEALPATAGAALSIGRSWAVGFPPVVKRTSLRSAFTPSGVFVLAAELLDLSFCLKSGRAALAQFTPRQTFMLENSAQRILRTTKCAPVSDVAAAKTRKPSVPSALKKWTS
jgi:hypothetical protein